MSYVQGSQVRLQADFLDMFTEQPFDPPTVVVTIQPPTLPSFTAELGDGVVNDPDRVGRFYYVLDTSPEPGTWRYQFENPGPDRRVERKEVTVTKRLT